MKKVALYDLDSSNGGLAKYSEIKDDAFVGVLAVPPLTAPGEFFTGIMLDGEPDAVVVDLPGNPMKTFGAEVSEKVFVQTLFGCVNFDFVPVPVYPITEKSVSTDSLDNALNLFESGPFGVCFNEFGLSAVLLDSGRGYPSYSRVEQRVKDRNGIEFSFPEMLKGSSKQAMDVDMKPFEVGFPVSASGARLSVSQQNAELADWLTPRGYRSAQIRTVYMNEKIFYEAALPQIESFVDRVLERVGDAKPVFMPYSDKGGEGTSMMTRLLATYLRRYWANGIRFDNRQ